jgi:hypothetical protein
MDEIVKMVAQKTGIPEDKARTAVDVVVNQLKAHLPSGMSGQIDSALQGGTAPGGGLGDMIGKLGGQ